MLQTRFLNGCDLLATSKCTKTLSSHLYGVLTCCIGKAEGGSMHGADAILRSPRVVRRRTGRLRISPAAGERQPERARGLWKTKHLTGSIAGGCFGCMQQTGERNPHWEQQLDLGAEDTSSDRIFVLNSAPLSARLGCELGAPSFKTPVMCSLTAGLSLTTMHVVGWMDSGEKAGGRSTVIDKA